MANFFEDDEPTSNEILEIDEFTINKIVNCRSDIDTIYNTYSEGDKVLIHAEGVSENTIGYVRNIMQKKSKFINDYLLYHIEYISNDNETITEWFYNNELYPVGSEINRKMRKKRYVNNRDMVRSLLAWQEEYRKDNTTPMPLYLIECFKKIIENLSHQCSTHTEVEDMKSNALVTCMSYGHNFDINESTNAFAYFTRYIKNAFAQIHNANKAFIDFKFNIVKEAENADNYNYRDRSEIEGD